MGPARAIVLTLWLPLAAIASSSPQGGAPGSVPTVSRLVLLFSRLETEWMEAARSGDAAALDRLVADDFEVRSARAPAIPTPRAEWLAAARGRPVPTPTAMAVRAVGDVAVVSCRMEAEKGARSFVVDLWTRHGEGWRIAARYVSDAPAD